MLAWRKVHNGLDRRPGNLSTPDLQAFHLRKSPKIGGTTYRKNRYWQLDLACQSIFSEVWGAMDIEILAMNLQAVRRTCLLHAATRL